MVILGCQHLVQLVENELNPTFRQLIETVLEHHRVGFIAEEAEQGRDTIAQEIAATRGPPKHRYPSLCAASNPASSVYEIQPRHRVEVVVDSDKYALGWNLVREHHMYKTFVDALTGADPSLLICGRSHVTGLVELFGDRYKVIPICFDRRTAAGYATA